MGAGEGAILTSYRKTWSVFERSGLFHSARNKSAGDRRGMDCCGQNQSLRYSMRSKYVRVLNVSGHSSASGGLTAVAISLAPPWL